MRRNRSNRAPDLRSTSLGRSRSVGQSARRSLDTLLASVAAGRAARQNDGTLLSTSSEEQMLFHHVTLPCPAIHPSTLPAPRRASGLVQPSTAADVPEPGTLASVERLLAAPAR